MQLFHTRTTFRIEDQLIEVRRYDLVDGVQIFDSRQLQATSADEADAQSEEIYRAARLMRTVGFYRGLFDNSYREIRATYQREPERAVQRAIATVTSLCKKLDCVLLIPEIRPLLDIEAERPDMWSVLRSRILIRPELPLTFVIGLEVPFVALDRPDLTRDALIGELRQSGIDADSLKETVTQTYRIIEKQARREHKEKELSDLIKKGMHEAEQRGTKPGNPAIAEAQRRARLLHQARRPSEETLSLIMRLKDEGNSLREIAKMRNERKISTPQNKRWYASSIRNYLGELKREPE